MTGPRAEKIVLGIAAYLPLVILAVIWEATTRLGLVSARLLPPFSDVVAAFFDLLRSGELLTNAVASLRRALLGFVIAVCTGTTLGAGMALVPWIRSALDPIVQIFYPLPKSALIPLVLVWFGLVSQVILLSATWISVDMADHGQSAADVARRQGLLPRGRHPRPRARRGARLR